MRPWRARWQASGPAAEPVAASSPPAQNIRVFQRSPDPAKQLTPVAPNSTTAATFGRSAATSSSEPSATKRCVAPLSYSSTGSSEPATPSASHSAAPAGNGSTVGTGCSIRPKTMRPDSSRSSATGTLPRPVSSVITPSWSGAPSTKAVPSVGCPANGSSKYGVKMRIRTLPPALGREDEHRSR